MNNRDKTNQTNLPSAPKKELMIKLINFYLIFTASELLFNWKASSIT